LPSVTVEQEVVLLSYEAEGVSSHEGPIETTMGTALNSTHIMCLSPVWPYESGSFTFALSDGNKTLRTPAKWNATESLIIAFEAEVLGMSPRSGVVGGSTVTISGSGLDTSRRRSSYVCGFQDGSGNSSVIRAESAGRARQTLTCPLPDWKNGAGVVTVRVADTLKDVWLQPHVDMSFELLEVLHGIHPATGPASGDTIVTVLGRGFRNVSYVIMLENALTSLSVPTEFVNESVLIFAAPRWPSRAADTTVSIYKPSGLMNQSTRITYTYYEVMERSSPDHGRVFGSYMSIQGAGFAADNSYACVLLPIQPGAVPQMYSELTSPPTGSSSFMECIFPAWDYAAQRMRVGLVHNGALVHSLGTFYFELKSAWTVASLPTSVDFQGGMPITVTGKGFDPSLPSGYTCQFLDASRSRCPPESSDCVAHSSADHTIPKQFRGPFNATSTTEIVCWVPTWLKEHPHAWLRLLANTTLVEKVYRSSQGVEFVGAPKVLAGLGNSPSAGGQRVLLVGQGFGLVDLTPQARIGLTACDSTEWVSSTSLRCKVPKATTGPLTASVAATVGPWRIGTQSGGFVYDAPAPTT